MKTFKSYLTESHRTYDFRIRIAGDMSDDMITKMKRALETYKVESISKPKRMPIQESPIFPNMGPVEINVIDVTLAYPANDDQVRNLVAECGCAAAACIKVTPAHSPYEAALAGEEISNKGGDTVLLQQEMVAEKVDADLMGDARIPNLIKELADTRKYEYPEAAGGDLATAKTTNEIPVGRASPIGTHQNKIPVAKKMPAGNGR
jgi:hypothetical protein